MKADLKKAIVDMKPGLQAILDKGFYEKVVDVCGYKVEMHILTKGEEAEVSKAVGSLDMITREYQRQIEHMAHATSKVGDTAFDSIEEARKFFNTMSNTMFSAFIDAYNDLLPKSKEEIIALGQAIKN